MTQWLFLVKDEGFYSLRKSSAPVEILSLMLSTIRITTSACLRQKQELLMDIQRKERFALQHYLAVHVAAAL